MPGIDTSLVDEAEGEARQGAAANARLLKTEEAKMDAGNEQLMAWNQQQLNKYDGNKIIQDPKGYIHQENVKQEKAATFSDKDFLDKLDKLMQRYDSNGMARCGWLDLLALRRIDQLNQARSRPLLLPFRPLACPALSTRHRAAAGRWCCRHARCVRVWVVGRVCVLRLLPLRGPGVQKGASPPRSSRALHGHSPWR